MACTLTDFPSTSAHHPEIFLNFYFLITQLDCILLKSLPTQPGYSGYLGDQPENYFTRGVYETDR